MKKAISCTIAAMLCFAVLLSSASAVEKKHEDDIFKVIRDPAGRTYFPKGRESFYTYYLAAMKEPSLMPKPKSADAFALRFTWLRSSHDPISIRVWREGTDYRIRAVRMTQEQDGSLGPKKTDAIRRLTKGEVAEIQRLLSAKRLWKPLDENQEILMSAMNDGAGWIFEHLNHQGYSMMDLHSPTYFTPEEYEKNGIDVTKTTDLKSYVRLGTYLLKITELLPDKREEIY